MGFLSIEDTPASSAAYRSIERLSYTFVKFLFALTLADLVALRSCPLLRYRMCENHC